MKNLVEGSCLLSVIVLITVVLFLCVNSWRIALTSYELTLVKQEYEQYRSAAQLLINWTTGRCMKNFDAVLQHCILNKNIVITFVRWHLYKSDYNARITIKCPKDNVLALEALFLKGKKELHTLKSTIRKKIKNDVTTFKLYV